MSRIVFWFRYVLNCCRNRGRSSPASRPCSSRYPSADSTESSSSAVSTGYCRRNSPIAPTIVLASRFSRSPRRAASSLIVAAAAFSALSHAEAGRGRGCPALASSPAIPSNVLPRRRAGRSPSTARDFAQHALSRRRLLRTPPSGVCVALRASRVGGIDPLLHRLQRGGQLGEFRGRRLQPVAFVLQILDPVDRDCQSMSENSRVSSRRASTSRALTRGGLALLLLSSAPTALELVGLTAGPGRSAHRSCARWTSRAHTACGRRSAAGHPSRAGRPALDLAGLGDRPGQPAELGHRRDAFVVGATGQAHVPATRRTGCP